MTNFKIFISFPSDPDVMDLCDFFNCISDFASLQVGSLFTINCEEDDYFDDNRECKPLSVNMDVVREIKKRAEAS